MKLVKTWSLLSLAVVLALLAMALPVAPAMAAAVINITLNGVAAVTGTPGSTVTVAANGFVAGGTYTIRFGTTTAINGTGTVAGGGTISRLVTVPPLPQGTVNVTITTTGGDSTVGAGPTFTATPGITLSPTSGSIGQTLSVVGNGFAATSSVTVYYDSVAQRTTSTSTAGTFSTSFAVPSYSGVNHTVQAIDAASNSAIATFTIVTSVSISPATVNVGSQTTVTGSGYGATRTVSIYVDSILQVTTTSTSTGTFSVSLPIPAGVIGTHTLTATDNLGNTAFTTYTVNPSITFTPSSFTSGTQVTVSGSGLAASSIVALYIDSSLFNSNAATTNSLGSFSTTFTVPKLPGGSHTFQARDASSNSSTVSFALTQGITISPASGPAGTTVHVTGNSFGAGVAIAINFDGARVATSPSSPTTDAGGAFTASFTAPPGSGGPHTITVSDGTLSATAAFTIMANAELSVVRGTIGTTVTASGTSFNANGAIVVTYDNSPVTTTIADAGGNFSAPFIVPTSAFGTHTVVVTDGTRNVTFTFSVVPSATLSPTSGYVGSSVTVIGSGFLARTPISVRYDSTQVGTTTSDATGGFSVTFRAPASQGGNHSITSTDGTSTIISVFAMDSTPPPVPTLVSPPNDSKADALTTFEWTAAGDPSGVTYVLQVSHDASFGVLLLEKTSLTTLGYQLTEEEKLASTSRQQPYYWRVKAVDGASNESAFTPAQTFYVGFVLATWALYVIFAAAVIIAAVLGFLGGRRRARLH